MEQTQNYKLNKPGYEDFGDIKTLNENADKIDTALGDLNRHAKTKGNPHSTTAAQVGAYTKAEIDTKMSGVVTTDNIMSKLGTVPITKGGTGVTTMVAADYSTNRPRGITISSSAPSSVPSGCIVLTYSNVGG